MAWLRLMQMTFFNMSKPVNRQVLYTWCLYEMLCHRRLVVQWRKMEWQRVEWMGRNVNCQWILHIVDWHLFEHYIKKVVKPTKCNFEFKKCVKVPLFLNEGIIVWVCWLFQKFLQQICQLWSYPKSPIALLGKSIDMNIDGQIRNDLDRILPAAF